MIQTTYNNWFKWYYDGKLLSRKQTVSSNLTIELDSNITSYFSIKYEIRRNAIKTLECFPNKKISILFSGGIDSELVARTFKDLNVDMHAYIFRYENDFNLYDVSHAVTVAELYNIPYKIIDFSLAKFFENEAEHISEVSQIGDPRGLPQLKFIDYIDDNSLVIGGDGNATWRRLKCSSNYKEVTYQAQMVEDTDYTKKGFWVHVNDEIEIGWERYSKEKNREAIMCWLKFTPELYLAQITSDWSKKLRNDEYIGKLGINSTKILGWRQVYPDIITRTKKYGLEKVEPLVAEYREFLIKKYKGEISNRVVLKTIDDVFAEMTRGSIKNG